ncbi:prepilin-type N-terminal cleavage/methylation domain-containing protein [Aquisalibacillus elongatus]|uniref:Type IV pilus assembly protein PilA n=1 Tax=Aquisalibacillus elongatus TaxID=485577 RepID=A0A3N5C2Y6_9BACI|nr:prepilin-type N-terminal cleavage/methylation domain-containing protein [Aquisalibacillus elongatus]RPF50561.1 type IV pilus assembly protein PilA [Aquisalibacillus elongatus]
MMKKVQNLLKKQKGVTLIELLAVIIILGIIALIAVPAIAGIISDSKADSIKSSAINYINAAEMYEVTEGIDSDGVTLEELRDEDYVDDNEGVAWSDGAKVILDSGEYKIDGSGQIDRVQVVLGNATIKDINDVANNVTVNDDVEPTS